MTAEQMREDRDAWLAMRRGHDDVPGFFCIGSSDTAGILGIAFGAERSGTPVRTWLEKTRGLQTPDNAPMMWGRLHEDTIGDYWRVRNRSVTEDVGLIANVDQPWHQTSLDRVVLECPLDRRVKERCALEIKTRNAFGMKRWHNELPDDVLAQMAHQLFVTGFEHLHYAVLVGGSNYHQGVVRREDQEDVVKFVIDKANHFRSAYLDPDNLVEPPWDQDMAAQSYMELDQLKYPERLGSLDIDDIGEVLEIATVRAKKNLYTRLEKEAKARLLRQAQGARHLTYASELVYEYVPRTRKNVNQERLAELYPDAWADPEVVTETTSWQLNLADAFKIKNVEEDE